jgi:8-oxo-dGTP diphosphatase
MINAGNLVLQMRPKIFCPYCGKSLVRKNIEGANRLFCADCQDVIYENPVPATCIIVANAQNHILLVKRKVLPKIGLWCLPGGFIELGESPEQSALRELKEETNLTGHIDRLLGVVTSPSDRYGSALLVCYQMADWQGTPIAGDDASDINFFPSNQLPEIAFLSHSSFIRLYFAAYEK